MDDRVSLPDKTTKERLRELARVVREYAQDPVNDEHIDVWTSVNDRRMIRPAVLVRDYPRYLINIDDEVTQSIEDPFWAGLEYDLQSRIYEWKHMRCDQVIQPEIYCPAEIRDSRFGVRASAVDTMQGVNEPYSRAVHFDRIIDSEEDLDRIRHADIEYDEETTLERAAQMQDVFDGILDVKIHGISFFHFAPWDDLLSWMGLEEGLYDFILNPGLMHKAMRKYMDVSVARAKKYEELGLVSPNNRNIPVGAGGYGYCSDLPIPDGNGIGARLADNWGDNCDQIMTSVSPQMSEEFGFDHEKEWSSLFGLNYYGCCECLSNKTTEAEQLPKLRKISMSPFARLEEGMSGLEGRVVISYKPNSIHLAKTPWDREALKNELIDACGLARKYGCSMEIVMKTLITLDGDPTRLWEWSEMAVDIAENY